jgi:hypothetical protein
MTKQEIESIGFEYMGKSFYARSNNVYKKSLGRLWIELTEMPFTTHTVYQISASPTQYGESTIVVHSITLETLDELKTLLKQLNLHD